MTVTALADVIDVIVPAWQQVADALDGGVEDRALIVLDGYGTGDQGYQNVLQVGVLDPTSGDPAPSGQADQEFTYANTTARTEVADVVSTLTCSTGETDQKAVRDRAKTYLEAIGAWLRANYNLGGVVTFCGITRVDLAQQQDDQGCIARFTFTLTYSARI